MASQWSPLRSLSEQAEMMCLMAVTDQLNAGARADPLMNPQCSELLVWQWQ